MILDIAKTIVFIIMIAGGIMLALLFIFALLNKLFPSNKVIDKITTALIYGFCGVILLWVGLGVIQYFIGV